MNRPYRISVLLNKLAKFDRPYGDNAGAEWNGPEIFPKLPDEAQAIVSELEEIGRPLITRLDMEGETVANRRGINALHRRGICADFGCDQYDPNRNVGRIARDDMWINFSDPASDSDSEPCCA